MPQNPLIADWARTVWEQALESAEGIRLSYDKKSAASKARFALYNARNYNRLENKEIYPAGDALHGRSLWDNFRIVLQKGLEPRTWELIVEPQDKTPFRPSRVERVSSKE